MIRAANQKHHVGLLVKCKKGGKWLNYAVHKRSFESLTHSFIHGELRLNTYSMPLEFCLVDCIRRSPH